MVVEPLTVPDAAVIVAVPGEAPVTKPVVVILAIVESEVDQKALFVRSCVVPSLKVPVAAICRVLPCWNVGVVGPTVRVDSVGFTKNPVHPMPIATMRSAIDPANSWNFRLCLFMLENQIVRGPELVTPSFLINCSREHSANALRADMYQSVHGTMPIPVPNKRRMSERATLAEKNRAIWLFSQTPP